MPQPHRSGTFAMVHAAVIDDRRVGAAELRVLVALGTYADMEGWCWPKQKQLADRLGITRQAVSKALRDLAAHGYIEIHLQHDQATGSQIASRYRVRLDFDLPAEFRRTPQPDIAGGIKVTLRPPQPDVDGPATPEVAPPATPEVAPIEEQTKRTNQLNRPKGVQRSDERPPSQTRSGQLIDALRAQGIDIAQTMRPQDHKELKASPADVALVAEAYGALFRGEWGDDWMRRSLSVQFVISRLGAYEAWKRNPKPATPSRNGSDRMLPGAASKQSSKWTDPEVMKQWRGKVGGVSTEARDGR